MKTPEERLRAQLAGLESQMDFLESEMTQIDALLRECGFPNGLVSLKKTVERMVQENRAKNPFSSD